MYNNTKSIIILRKEKKDILEYKIVLNMNMDLRDKGQFTYPSHFSKYAI